MAMKLTNTDRFALKGTNGRFIHLATVVDGMHEYMCFYDLVEHKLYIEEISGGNLKFIEDDKLAEELANFLFDKRVTDLKHGIPAPDPKFLDS